MGLSEVKQLAQDHKATRVSQNSICVPSDGIPGQELLLPA